MRITIVLHSCADSLRRFFLRTTHLDRPWLCMYVCNDSRLQCVPHVCSVTLKEATTAPDGFIGDEFNCTGECMLHISLQ